VLFVRVLSLPPKLNARNGRWSWSRKPSASSSSRAERVAREALSAFLASVTSWVADRSKVKPAAWTILVTVPAERLVSRAMALRDMPVAWRSRIRSRSSR
jgi:hypothetical protein